MPKSVQQTGSLWRAALKFWKIGLFAALCLALGIAIMHDVIFTSLSPWWRDTIAVGAIVFGFYNAAVVAVLSFYQRHRN